jgi:hypothetical protein
MGKFEIVDIEIIKSHPKTDLGWLGVKTSISGEQVFVFA